MARRDDLISNIMRKNPGLSQADAAAAADAALAGQVRSPAEAKAEQDRASKRAKAVPQKLQTTPNTTPPEQKEAAGSPSVSQAEKEKALKQMIDQGIPADTAAKVLGVPSSTAARVKKKKAPRTVSPPPEKPDPEEKEFPDSTSVFDENDAGFKMKIKKPKGPFRQKLEAAISESLHKNLGYLGRYLSQKMIGKRGAHGSVARTDDFALFERSITKGLDRVTRSIERAADALERGGGSKMGAGIAAGLGTSMLPKGLTATLGMIAGIAGVAAVGSIFASTSALGKPNTGLDNRAGTGNPTDEIDPFAPGGGQGAVPDEMKDLTLRAKDLTYRAQEITFEADEFDTGGLGLEGGSGGGGTGGGME